MFFMTSLIALLIVMLIWHLYFKQGPIVYLTIANWRKSLSIWKRLILIYIIVAIPLWLYSILHNKWDLQIYTFFYQFFSRLFSINLYPVPFDLGYNLLWSIVILLWYLTWIRKLPSLNRAY